MKLVQVAGLLILSFLLTIIVTVIDAILRNQLVAGRAGFPFRFSDMSLFGGGETNYLILSLDMFFWFFILVVMFKFIPKLFLKPKR